MEDASFALALQTVAAWVTFLGLVGLTGAVTCGRLISVPREKEHEIERVFGRLAVGSALVLLLGATMRLYAQTWSVFGLDEPVTLDLVRVVGLESRWSAFWRPQAGVAVLALVAVSWWRRWPRAGRGSATLAIVTGWATLPLTGHAMSFGSPVPWGFQAVHGLAAGFWVGTLAAILVAAPRLTRGMGGHAQIAFLIRRFSPLAVVAVLVVAISGLVTTVFHLETVEQLWTTRYGQVLLLKVGLFLVTGAIGLRNWRRITPRLGNVFATYELRRAIRFEVAAALFVLLVTALLIHLAMPYVPM